jgi:two-component system, NtrC family, sensor histidine kinase HydH
MAIDEDKSVSTDDQSSAMVQRLLDQYTEIARLAGGLAHEIKNPLSTIRLNMQLLSEDLSEAKTPAERRALKRVEVVQRECQRLQALLDDFLNYAKVRRLQLEPSDLNHQIEDVLDFFAPEADEAGVQIVRYLDADLPHVLLDREAFRRALLNLIINARQAMPDGGQLVVRTATEGDHVAIFLIDTGHGMDDRTASKMFEAFFSTKPGGSGLGLPTTQKIIAGHGGCITVQSEVGRGTQFTIELPVPARIPGE